MIAVTVRWHAQASRLVQGKNMGIIKLWKYLISAFQQVQRCLQDAHMGLDATKQDLQDTSACYYAITKGLV